MLSDWAKDIEDYGCHILHFMDDGDYPAFACSIGIGKMSEQPEIFGAYMNIKLRYVLAVILGISVSVTVWLQIASAHPIFAQLQLSGLIAPVAASILGGFIVSVVSPKHKIRLSALVGFVVTLPMLVFMLNDGFSHFGRNPFIWYWPVYIVPFFCVGGFLGRNIWRLT